MDEAAHEDGPDAHVASVSLDRSVLFGGGSFRMLGERILWPGFAINTLFYAAIVWGVWLLFAVPFAFGGEASPPDYARAMADATLGVLGKYS